MNKIIGLFFIVTVLLLTFSSSNYVDAASYGTKASITFIEPEDEATSETDKSETEGIPGGDIVFESNDLEQNVNTLPKTATNKYALLLIGFIILVVGISSLIYYNRKKIK